MNHIYGELKVSDFLGVIIVTQKNAPIEVDDVHEWVSEGWWYSLVHGEVDEWPDPESYCAELSESQGNVVAGFTDRKILQECSTS